MEAGGGVPGKGAGIVRTIMIRVGLATRVHRLFMQTFPHDGERITESITGKDIRGNTRKFPPVSFKGTGAAGRRKSTGNGSNTGVFRT